MKRVFSVLAIASLLLGMLVTPAAAQGPFTTAFAVQNLSPSETAQITVAFYTEEGGAAPIYTTPVVSVAPGALGNFLAGDGLPDGWQGSVVVSSNTPISAIANTADNFTTPRYWGTYEGFTDNPLVAPTTAQTLYVPFALRERSGRSSIIGVQNAGQSSATVTIQFIGHASSPTNWTVTKVLNPSTSTILHLATEVPNLGSGWMGSAVISSATVPLAASVLDVGTDLVYSYSGIPAPATNLVLPFIVGSRSNQDTAHAMLNPNAVPANVTITYKGQIGATPTTIVQSRTLAPNEMWNLAHNTHTGAGFLGSAIVTSDQPVLGIVNHTYGSFGAPGKKMSYGMIDASKLTSKISLPYVLRERSNKRQGIIIQNAGAVATTLSIEFKPAAGPGNGNAYTYTKVVEAGGFYNFGTFFTEWDPIGNGAFGTMVVTCSPSVPIVAIVNTWNTAVSESVDSLGSYIGTNY